MTPKKLLLAIGAAGLTASLATVWLLRFGDSPSAAHHAETAVRKLRTVTFNVQFLPGPASVFNKRPQPEYRARTLGERLSAYDIIGLNEVFHPKYRKILLAKLQQQMGSDFHCVTAPESARSSFGIDGGLALVSRLPIIASHYLQYQNDSSIWKHGLLADGFASKGVLHARVKRGQDAADDDCIDVFTTHLESQDAGVREAQYPMLAEFVRAHRDPLRPCLLLGDFNTVGNPVEVKDRSSQYQRMLGVLERAQAHPVCDLWLATSKDQGGTSDPDSADGGARIDYVFLLDALERARLQPTAVRVNRFLDARVTSLSDHAAVEADFDWPPLANN